MMTTNEYKSILKQWLADIKDEQAKCIVKVCPRCGAEIFSKPDQLPMSSQLDVRICKDCAAQEGWLKTVNQKPLPVELWYFAAPPIDAVFCGVCADDAWHEIERNQTSALQALFERWLDEGDTNAGYAYRYQAISDFKGVTDAWFEKRMTVKYAVLDGEIAVIFEKHNGGVVYAARHETKGGKVTWLT